MRRGVIARFIMALAVYIINNNRSRRQNEPSPDHFIFDFGTINIKWHPEEQKRQRETENKQHNRRIWEYFFQCLSVFAAGGAFVVSCFSLTETRDATREAHTQAIEAKRQADYAEPRAWIYIALTNSIEPPLISALPNGKRNITIWQPITLTNYGNTPATIEKIEATMVIPNNMFVFGDEVTNPVDHQPGFSYKNISSEGIDRDIALSEFVGKIIATNKDLSTSVVRPSFFFHAQNDMLTHGVPSQTYIKVFYRDPFGERTACFFGRIFGAEITKSGGEAYSNCK